MSSNIFRLADRLFNQPLLATESLAHSAATYVNNRLLGDVQAAVNFDKPKGEARSLLKVKDDIAIIPIMGGLTHRMTFIDAMCTGGLSSYEGLRRGFDEALADESIKTIVLHIDSGGGEASGCFELARHIMASRGQKKIIAYVDEFACSAAYALASSAEEIIASPDADVGSIGVIMVHQELTKAFEKNGVTINVIKAGEFKGMGSPFQALSEESKERLQKRINDTYATFTGFVAESRNLSEEAVKNTEANVYSAQEALELGLINSIMSQDDFLNYLQGSEEAPVSLNVNNSGEEMTEQEKQEL
ncbi:TPA: signal peptide peptidase SppA, partial [Escherichia coli]|nr:signal peptide peptidase SppA [Escherichia coli]